jgi:release factor glutamine methyltransferase
VPLQYFLGDTEFCGLTIKVNRNVFIPRPETEVMVEKIIAQFKDHQGSLKILDLCTGSGNIAVSLAKNLPDCEVTAADICSRAIAQAAKNARINQVNHGRIGFVKSDLFENIRGKFDIITINPPYIPSADIYRLGKEISFEPRIALNGGIDGLNFYRLIFQKASDFMNDNAFLFMEMGDDQSGQISRILSKSHELILKDIIKDNNNKPRVLVIQKVQDG